MNTRKSLLSSVSTATLSAVVVFLCSVTAFAGPLMNQLGYAPEAEKQVVIPGNDANGLEPTLF